MNCKHCSTNLPEGIYFCPSCGHLSVEAEFKNQELAKKVRRYAADFGGCHNRKEPLWIEEIKAKYGL